MADRMRVNLGQINGYNGSYSAATAVTDPCAAGIPCPPAQLVARDRALWSQQLVQFLPNPTAIVACDGAPLGVAGQAGAAPYDGLCTLTITWDEASLRRGELSAAPGAAAADLQTFAWVFQP
jgi:hypothetical protein